MTDTSTFVSGEAPLKAKSTPKAADLAAEATETTEIVDPIDAVVAAVFPEWVAPQPDPEAVLKTFGANGGARDFALSKVVAITDGKLIPNPRRNGPKNIQGAVIHVKRNVKNPDGTPGVTVNAVQLSEHPKTVRANAEAQGYVDIPDKAPASAGRRATSKRTGQPAKNMGSSNEEVEAFVVKTLKAAPNSTVPSLIAGAAAAGLSVSRNRLAKIATDHGVRLGQRSGMGSSNEEAAKVVAAAFKGDAKLTVRDLQTFVAEAGLSVCRNRLVGLADKAGFRFVKASRSVKAPAAKTEPKPAPKTSTKASAKAPTKPTPAPKASKAPAKPKPAPKATSNVVSITVGSQKPKTTRKPAAAKKA